MRDIYYLTCPVTNDIKCISKARYPKVQPTLATHPDYREWVRFLKRRRLSPIFKILDRVPDKKFNKEFNRYIEKFQNQGIQLFNFTPIRKFKVFEHFLIPKNSDLYLLEDMGYIHERLEAIFFEKLGHVRHHSEADLVKEMIYFIGGLIDYKISYKDLLFINVSDIKKSHSSRTGRRYLYIESCFDRIIENKEDEEQVFQIIPQYKIECILNGINHLFAFYQIQIILTERILANISGIYTYFTNTQEMKYWHKIVDEVNSIMRNRKSKIKPQDFNKMTEDVQAMIEHNLDFAYSKRDPKDLFKEIQGLP